MQCLSVPIELIYSLLLTVFMIAIIFMDTIIIVLRDMTSCIVVEITSFWTDVQIPPSG
jgi:hypothetical protein